MDYRVYVIRLTQSPYESHPYYEQFETPKRHLHFPTVNSPHNKKLITSYRDIRVKRVFLNIQENFLKKTTQRLTTEKCKSK